MNAVRAHFRPEFLNRLDDMILFESLTRENMDTIVDIQLAGLTRMLGERNITLELSEAARTWLADAGFDPVYGARPLRRVIERHVKNQLAERLLEGRIKDGDTVAVSANENGLLFPGDEGGPAAFVRPGGDDVSDQLTLH